jgi:hypothetical protein
MNPLAGITWRREREPDETPEIVYQRVENVYSVDKNNA